MNQSRSQSNRPHCSCADRIPPPHEPTPRPFRARAVRGDTPRPASETRRLQHEAEHGEASRAAATKKARAKALNQHTMDPPAVPCVSPQRPMHMPRSPEFPRLDRSTHLAAPASHPDRAHRHPATGTTASEGRKLVSCASIAHLDARAASTPVWRTCTLREPPAAARS